MNSFSLKSRWIVLSALVVGLLIASVISVGQQRVQRGPAVSIERIALEPAWDTFVVELRDGSVNQDTVLKIFERIYGYQVDLTTDEEAFFYTGGKADPSLFFLVDRRSGELSFTRSEFLMGGEQLPSGRECFAAVLAFLNDVGLAPLDEGEMMVAHVGGLTETTLHDNGRKTQEQKLVTIHIARHLFDRDVYGPGSKIIAHLNEFGIVGLTKRWTEIAEVTEAKAFGVQSPDKIPQLIETHLRNEWVSASKIEVTDIKLVYYDGMGNFIQPVYAFVARVMFTDESKILPFDYLGFVPALVDPPEPVFRAEIGDRGLPPIGAKPTQGEQD
jgi:hypothetical protein